MCKNCMYEYSVIPEKLYVLNRDAASELSSEHLMVVRRFVIEEDKEWIDNVIKSRDDYEKEKGSNR